MLNTMTQATFKYGGCMIIARRTVDITTGKFYCWYGEINENADFAIATKSLKKFEKTFIEIVDKANDPATSSD